MILQALAEYYRRKSSDPDAPLAPPGFELKAIPFVIVLDEQGRFIELEDTRALQGKKPVARSFLVPQSAGRSGTASWQTANLLWDHYGYVLGQPKPDEGDPTKAAELAAKQHGAFIAQVRGLLEALPHDAGVSAVWRFLNSEPEKIKIVAAPAWPDCLAIKGCNLTFRLKGKTELICQSPEIQSYVTDRNSEQDPTDKPGICLVTGERTIIARLHPKVSGVAKKPEAFAAANDGEIPSVSSFGRHQGFIFPVSKGAAFQYATALTHLLNSDQSFRLADMKVVAWTPKEAALEKIFPIFFQSWEQGDQDSSLVRAIKALFASVRTGAYAAADGSTRFHVLGLSANNARHVVRFWQTGTVGEFSERIARYFHDLDIDGREHHGYPSLYRLLLSTAALHKAENINPQLAGALVRAVLEDLPLPEALLQAVIRRLHAERAVTYERAALIKACLNRKHRKQPHEHKELTVALDPSNNDPGYRLGRLFAVLERIQESANPSRLNATIRDRYYSAASSAPVTVFANLLRLTNHHQGKLSHGSRTFYEKLLGDVMEGVEGFPAHLRIEQQGQFAIGYYHQRQALKRGGSAPEPTNA